MAKYSLFIAKSFYSSELNCLPIFSLYFDTLGIPSNPTLRSSSVGI